MKLKPIKVKCDFQWASIHEPNQKSGKYQVDICNLSKEAVKALEDSGLSVKYEAQPKKEGLIPRLYHVTAKSQKYPIKAYDSDGEQIEANVGNGSKGTALIKPYVNTFDKNINAGISTITVTELVQYDPEKTAEAAI